MDSSIYFFKLTFMKWKCSKCAQNVIFHAILANFGTIRSTQRPLTLQIKSTFTGSYYPKSLHKLLLPENGFNSIFFDAKMFKKCPNVIFHAFLANFGNIWPTQKPLILTKSTFCGSYSPLSLHKLLLPENGFNSIFFEAKMFEKCPKCHISCNFGQFWDHMTHSKAPYTTNEVRYMAHILPKYSIK